MHSFVNAVLNVLILYHTLQITTFHNLTVLFFTEITEVIGQNIEKHTPVSTIRYKVPQFTLHFRTKTKTVQNTVFLDQ